MENTVLEHHRFHKIRFVFYESSSGFTLVVPKTVRFPEPKAAVAVGVGTLLTNSDAGTLTGKPDLKVRLSPKKSRSAVLTLQADRQAGRQAGRQPRRPRDVMPVRWLSGSVSVCV